MLLFRIKTLFLALFAACALSGCTAFPFRPQQAWRSLADHDYPSEAVGTAAFEAALDAYTGSVALPLHNGRLLQNGDDFYPAILELIDGAVESIALETYIIERDRTTDTVFNALIAAVERGVRVRMLADAAGFHRGMIAQLDELTARGIEARIFNPLFLSWTFFRGNNRDHRKILVVDGKHAVLGGINLSNAQLGNGVTGWRDTALCVSGPAAHEALRAFEETWRQGGRGWAGKNLPLSSLSPLKRRVDSLLFAGHPDVAEPPAQSHAPAADPTAGTPTVRVVASAPDTRNSETYDLAIIGILGARERLDIASAYFVPPLALRRALLRAAENGVRIRLLLPEVTDVKWVREMGMRFYGQLLEAGIEIYEWPYPILHAKTMVADGKWLTVGSANMDSRSFFLNYEANLAVSDPILARQMHAQFEEDLTLARRLTPERWRTRGLIQRQLEWLSIPLAGQY